MFYSPRDGTRLIKRAVGLPGDLIELRNEQLIINGTAVDYGPLDSATSDQLPETQRRQSLFATEFLPGRPHAVMALPGLPALRSFGPVRVPEGRYFMMGDNRDNSFDSRYFGMVDRNRVVGKATAVVLSFNKAQHWRPRTQRFFSSLDPDSVK